MSVVLVAFFMAGAMLGSFLNVLIYRLPHGVHILGRSYCPHCKQTITWQDNIPLLSFVLLQGRCRHCHSLISWQYPIVEGITGVLFAFTYLFYGSLIYGQFLQLVYYLFIICCLVVVFFTDLRYGIIPDKITLPAIAVSLMLLVARFPHLLLPNLLSAIMASLFLFSFLLVTSGRGMGLGDVKFAFLLGLFLGFPNITLGIYFAFLTGGIVSVLLLIKGIKRIGQTVPFGPFLVTGAIIAFFFGKTIVEMYGLMTLFS